MTTLTGQIIRMCLFEVIFGDKVASVGIPKAHRVEQVCGTVVNGP